MWCNPDPRKPTYLFTCSDAYVTLFRDDFLDTLLRSFCFSCHSGDLHCFSVCCSDTLELEFFFFFFFFLHVVCLFADFVVLLFCGSVVPCILSCPTCPTCSCQNPFSSFIFSFDTLHSRVLFMFVLVYSFSSYPIPIPPPPSILNILPSSTFFHPPHFILRETKVVSGFWICITVRVSYLRVSVFVLVLVLTSVFVFYVL